jgi:pilus assembly protein CpaE
MNDLAYDAQPLDTQPEEAGGQAAPQAAPPPSAQPGMAASDTRGYKALPIPRINIQAFCEDDRTAQLLSEAAQDRRLARAHTTVQMGGIQAASAFYRDASTPNLILLESMRDQDTMLAELDRFSEVCDAGTKVIVIGHVNDVLLYRQLVARGVSEYLVMPLTVGQIMESLSNLYNESGAEPIGRVIAFVGAKGGCGSSTICHNTAWAIAEVVRSEVVITDFDLPFGTAGLDFNQDPIQGIGDALLSPDRLDEVLLDRLLSRCSDHLSLFAAPGTLERTYDLGPAACEKVIDTVRRNVPFVVADVPHVWTEWAQRLVVQADQIVITANPDLANLRNAKNLIDRMKAARPNDKLPILVLNQVGMPKRPEISISDFTSALEIQSHLVVDFDAELFGTAANNGQMVQEISTKAKASERFNELAFLLCDRDEPKAEQQSALEGLLGRFNLKKLGL